MSTASKRRTGVVLTVVIALIAGGMLVAFVLSQSSKPGTKVSLGTQVFDAGSTKHLADEIASGGPVLNPALTKGGPDIYIQHLGADPTAGWSAFAAQAAGQGRRCTLQWQAAAHQFVDPCTQRTYPADGAGLQQFRTGVTSDGHLTIDFRAS